MLLGRIVSRQKFIWIHNGKFKLSGVQFNVFARDKTLQNLSDTVMKIKQVLKDWTYRNVSLLVCLLDLEPKTSEDIMSQSIWFNTKIQA